MAVKPELSKQHSGKKSKPRNLPRVGRISHLPRVGRIIRIQKIHGCKSKNKNKS